MGSGALLPAPATPEGEASSVSLLAELAPGLLEANPSPTHLGTCVFLPAGPCEPIFGGLDSTLTVNISTSRRKGGGGPARVCSASRCSSGHPSARAVEADASTAPL